MTRPEALFPLFADLETLEGVGPKTAQAFAALGVGKPKDLLYLLPHAAIDRSRKPSIRDVVPPCTVTVEIDVGAHVPPRQKGKPYRVMVRDAVKRPHKDLPSPASVKKRAGAAAAPAAAAPAAEEPKAEA